MLHLPCTKTLEVTHDNGIYPVPKDGAHIVEDCQEGCTRRAVLQKSRKIPNFVDDECASRFDMHLDK
jgi:hypothetical protein